MSADNTTVANRVDQFMGLLSSQGYSEATLYEYGLALKKYLRCLEQAKDLPMREVSLSQREDALKWALKTTSTARHTLFRNLITRFINFLVDQGDIEPLPEITDMSPNAILRREYITYLKEIRSLSESSIYHCLRYFDKFLKFKFDNNDWQLNRIKPADIERFMIEVRKVNKEFRDKSLPSNLRSLFQFLFFAEYTKKDLSKNVLSPRRAPSSTNIPRYIHPDEIDALVKAGSTGAKTAKRNQTMLILYARYGLRSKEVVSIELKDIDWRKGEILINGKGGYEDYMPLTPEIGEALVDYIKHERKGSSEMLFVSSYPPYESLCSNTTMHNLVQNAYKSAGISRPQNYVGTRVFRHSLATDALSKGATLSEVGNLLRHRSPMTTTIYAKHTLEDLRSLARPWPVRD